MVNNIKLRYKRGVFMPEGNIDLPEDTVVIIKSMKVRGNLSKEDINEIKEKLKNLPKTKIDFKKLEEIYYEGKMFG